MMHTAVRMNLRNFFVAAMLTAIALFGMHAFAQPSARRDHIPQADPTVHSVPAPTVEPMPSSGGYRPETRSGSGEEGSVRIQRQPHAPADRGALPPPAPLSKLAEKSENGITWLCGGVGQDEADFMKEAARDYDLMLTFAARDGSYLADVNVDIADARNKSLLKTSCNAPIMLLDLGKAGTYRILAETGGSAVSKVVQVQRAKGKAVVLVWPVQQEDSPAPER
jgi:hypothetical protein